MLRYPQNFFQTTPRCSMSLLLALLFFFPIILSAASHKLVSGWKFTKAQGKIFPLADAVASVKKNGKSFFETNYDDSNWKDVSVPHAPNADDSFDSLIHDAGEDELYRGFMFYRTKFELKDVNNNKKYFLEFEAVRQSLYLYVNEQFVGYYEAGVAPIGFDITKFVKPSINTIAVATDNAASRGSSFTTQETKPGHTPGDLSGSGYQWNQKDFNPVQGGLTGNVILHEKSDLYLTLPLYNNLKTTGTYIWADNFTEKSARIHVLAEIRNESGKDENVSVEVELLQPEKNNTVFSKFSTEKEFSVPQAKDKGKVLQTVVSEHAYDRNAPLANAETVQVSYVEASAFIENLNLWSPDSPYLYDVKVTLKKQGGIICDSIVIRTGFRNVQYSIRTGLTINGKPFYLKGYSQRSTNEWAVIGVANDWLNDFDARLIRESGANFIRWMHVTPKPSPVRAYDKYGIVNVAPAGDKEKDTQVREWEQRVEAMRDTIIYFRNSPSVVFYEAGNNAITAKHMQEMTDMKRKLDPNGGRFMGCRTITTPEQIKAAEWVGTMIWRHDKDAKRSMDELKRYLPLVETEYKREEAPRRIWDDFTPPDYDYVNKFLGNGAKKKDGFDVWDLTQENFSTTTASSGDGYSYFYLNRVGGPGKNYYSAAAMMVWSDSNMHGRNAGSENCRTTGRVDPIRIPKESFYAVQTYQAENPQVKILGHWNYPQLNEKTYLYREKEWNGQFWQVTDKISQRNPLDKTVYVIGSLHCASVKLFVNGKEVGHNNKPRDLFVFSFPHVNVTESGYIEAVAYDAKENVIAKDRIDTVGEPAAIRLTPKAAINKEKSSVMNADGEDIAFYDVEVIDNQGRVCPTYYDRIDFECEGPVEFLGGYNSGKFGKDSVIHKKYVFVECGTNRVFVRSISGKEGTIVLKAKSGKIAGESKALSSIDFVKNNLRNDDEVNRYKPVVAENKIPVVRGFAKEITEQKQNIYTIFVNGKNISLSLPAYRPDSATGVVAPIVPVLDALKAEGANIEYTIISSGKLPDYLKNFAFPLIRIKSNGTIVEIVQGETSIILNSGKDSNLTNCEFYMENGFLCGEIAPILGYIQNTEVITSDEQKIMKITTK